MIRLGCALLVVVATTLPALSQAAVPRFVERSARLGVDFVHRHFGRGEKYMPENMGSGVAILDVDGDGRLDLYFVQGAPLGPGAKPDPTATNRLYRQRANGTFEDVSLPSGAADPGYGMGVAYADYDGDGDFDLFITNFGANALYRNRGDGTFDSVTAAAGIGAAAWSTGAGFFDADGDGDLDLYVSNYVDFAFARHKWCGNAEKRLRSYCHPDLYDGLADLLYRNNGDGSFTDISQQAGLLRSVRDAKGLGLAFGDFDGDGRQDVFVANDSAMNHLYLSGSDGRFGEQALLAGVGFNAAGGAEAGMGVALGDFDGDGRVDLFLTHLDQETNTLYRNQGGGNFIDTTRRAGLASASLPWVGFGAVPFDFDNDGDLDLFVANGHILDNVELFDPTSSWRQPAQLFENQGDGSFVEISTALGLSEPWVGRGAAAADLDRDGDLDLVVSQNNGPARVLINQGTVGGYLAVELSGTNRNLHALGARLELRVGERRLTRWIKSSGSYLSQSPPIAWFGLGEAKLTDELRVTWLTGKTRRYLGLGVGHRILRLQDGLPVAKP